MEREERFAARRCTRGFNAVKSSMAQVASSTVERLGEARCYADKERRLVFVARGKGARSPECCGGEVCSSPTAVTTLAPLCSLDEEWAGTVPPSFRSYRTSYRSGEGAIDACRHSRLAAVLVEAYESVLRTARSRMQGACCCILIGRPPSTIPALTVYTLHSFFFFSFGTNCQRMEETTQHFHTSCASVCGGTLPIHITIDTPSRTRVTARRTAETGKQHLKVLHSRSTPTELRPPFACVCGAREVTGCLCACHLQR